MTTDREKKQGSGRELDELLNEAETLKRRADFRANKKQAASSQNTATEILESLSSVKENLSYFRRLLYSIKEGYLGFHERFLAPLWKILGPALRRIARLYGRIWNRFAYKTDKATAERVLSRARAGVVVGITFAFLAALTPTRTGDAVRFVTVEPVFDGILMAVSMKTETFYLNHAEEIDPEANEHAVRGCKHEGLCTERDAAYFRIKPRLSHDIWKLIRQGNPIYVPDHVVAPIAPGVNKCEVTYYGYRVTSSWISRLLRSFQIYPTMLEAGCTHLGSQR